MKNPTEIKIKLGPNGIMPTKGTEGAAAYDLYATEDVTLYVCCKIKMDLDFAIELPEGYAAFIYPRSGLGIDGLHLANVVGLIDSDYRGSIGAMLEFNPAIPNDGLVHNQAWDDPIKIKRGDRILQMVIQQIPDTTLIAAETLSTTKRGTGGYGSTGK